MIRNYPPAPLTSVERGKSGMWLLTITCPSCRSEHTHSGGRIDAAAKDRSALGIRAAHCHFGAKYMLTDPNDLIGHALGSGGTP